jgi:membrane-associated phospholipid phosphatase
MNSFDEAIGRSFAWLAQNGGAFFGPFFRGISFLGDYGIGFLLALAILAVFKKTRRSALVAFSAIALGFVFSNLMMKNLVARPRPFSDQTSPFYEWWVAAGSLGESGYSFPSGHTTLAASFAFSLFFFYPIWGENFLPIFSPTAGELPERFETQRNTNGTGNPHPTGRKGTIWNAMQHNRMAPDRLCNQ